MRPRLFAAIAVFALLAAGCGDDADTAEDDTAGDTTTTGGGSEEPEACGGLLGSFEPLEGVEFTPVKEGTFTVVTSLPGPGFWDGGDTIEAMDGGVEYCMARAIGELLGQDEFEPRAEAFDAITTGVIDGYDLALTQSSITPERDEVIDFTDSYYKSDQSILVAAGTSVETIEDVRALLFGTQVGTTGEFFATDLLGLTEAPQSFDTLDAAYTALVADQVDAVIMDTAINLGQAAASDGALEVAAQFANEDFYGGILPDGSTNVEAINAALAELESSGALAAFLTQYLGGDPTSVPFIEVP